MWEGEGKWDSERMRYDLVTNIWIPGGQLPLWTEQFLKQFDLWQKPEGANAAQKWESEDGF